MNPDKISQPKFPLLSKSARIVTLLAACYLSISHAWAEDVAIQCANLIYSMNQTSRCFSDEFLSAAQKETTIPTERRFKSVRLGSEELFQYPFVVMTGESSFFFSPIERTNLEAYLKKGGFLLASAGCSNSEWDRSFRTEMRKIFGDDALISIEPEHPVFKTVHTIKKLDLNHPGEEAKLEGLTLNGKIVAIYSKHGLNDTGNTFGCCCCGGNEIKNSLEINVNIFVYALLH
jgi:hypothetical protein